jgi:hypothetical protein
MDPAVKGSVSLRRAAVANFAATFVVALSAQIRMLLTTEAKMRAARMASVPASIRAAASGAIADLVAERALAGNLLELRDRSEI